MTAEGSLYRTSSFSVAPTKSRQGHSADITDATGTTIATSDDSGAVRDPSGAVLFQAPVRYESKPNRPIVAEMDVSDGSGTALGSGRVVKYGIGPRSKKATVALTDARGNEVLRLEPDKKGETLSLTAGGGEVATISVAEQKAGFMKKVRVYSVNFIGSVPDEVRPLAYAAAIRYDALLDAVAAAAMRDSMRD